MSTPSNKKTNQSLEIDFRDKPLTHSEWQKIPQPTFKWKIDILCDRMQSIENAALIIRTAMGLGVEKIFFLDQTFNWNAKKMDKLSRSAIQHMSIDQIHSVSEINLHPYTHIASLEYSKTSRSIYEHDLEGNTLLILGAEYDGVQEKLLQLSDSVYHIPLTGPQSSINAAQAFSGALTYLNASRIVK